MAATKNASAAKADGAPKVKAEKAALVSVTVKSAVQHGDTRYGPGEDGGEVLEGLTQKQADALVACGVADLIAAE